ncbi:MAG: hypothetical protein HY301_06275 [Verrucomicrobia bacterium]|nr:hypothetical protein [Verrucomicrobiota bacterium]
MEREAVNQTSAKPLCRDAGSFRSWVDGADPSTAELVAELLNWCYHGFGRGRGAEAAHLELFSALPTNGDAYPVKLRLARHIAAALAKQPNLLFPFPGYESAPDFLLYELLSLAGQLNCPEVLFEPLWRVREALLKSDLAHLPRARLALTKALIHNQHHHPGLLKVWMSMTEGRTDSVLIGPPEIGMEGIGMMPGAEDAERPNERAVSDGLLNLAGRYAANRRTRRQRFRAQVLWLKHLWALCDEYFIQLADKHQWVQKGFPWAVDALPDLFVSNFGETGHEVHCALAWHWFVECLCPWDLIKTERELCGGRVLQIRIPEQTSIQFDAVLRDVRGLAHFQPEISEDEAARYKTELMNRIESELRHRHKMQEAEKLAEAIVDFKKSTADLSIVRFPEQAAQALLA